MKAKKSKMRKQNENMFPKRKRNCRLFNISLSFNKPYRKKYSLSRNV